MTGEVFPVGLPQRAPPERGNSATSVRVIRIPLDTAQDFIRIEVKGNVMFAIDSSDTEAVMTLNFNDQSGAGVPVREGLLLTGIEFSRIYISNTAQAGKYIDLFTYVSTTTEFRALPHINAAATVAVTKGNTGAMLQHTVGVASATLLAADASRRSAMITNTSLTAIIYINFTAAAVVATHMPIYPRETFIIDQSATLLITAISDTAGTDVRTLTESD